MRYKKLPQYAYIQFLYRNKVILLTLIFSILALLATTIEDGLTHSDEELWLQGSSEYNKLLKESHPSSYISRVIVDLSKEKFTPKTISQLKKFHIHLKHQPNVIEVNSLYSQKRVTNQKLSQAQEMLEVHTLDEYEPDEIYSYLIANKKSCATFVDEDFKTMTFYVISSKNIVLNLNYTPFDYKIEGLKQQNGFENKTLFILLFLTIVVSFSIAFQSILPSILATIFISATALMSLALFQIFSVVKELHISIILVAITISLMDFIYIYYKWHIFQRKVNAKHALYRVLAKTLVPIFWTSVISIIAMGSLMFVKSHILYTIGFNVMLSALSGLILSVTLLPLMLSFFSQKNPQIITQNSSHFFAAKEAHSSPILIKIFLFITFIAFVYSMSAYYLKPLSIESNATNNQIQIALIESGVNNKTLKEIHAIEIKLHKHFPEIKSFQSAYTIMEKMYKTEYPNGTFNITAIDVDAYLFSFDLYDINDGLIIDDRVTLRIFLGENSHKSDILEFIRQEGFLIQDTNSLLYLAKMDSIIILFNVVIFVLLLIMCVIYYITRNRNFTIISLIVNIIPLIWFFTYIMFNEIPLSTEIFVAMIITVALSSDATLHFIYFYHYSRHKPRDATLSLERSFLNVGTPIGMGNLILLLTFSLLMFMPNETIANIGLYSSLLILLSLLVDLFILPILFLHHIKNNKKVKDYFHG